MPLDVELEPGEEMILEETLPGANKSDVPLSIAISNRALFLQRKKLIAVSDPWYFDKVAFARIRRVEVAPHSPMWLSVGGALMMLAGFGALSLAWDGGDAVRDAKLIGYGLALIVVGFAIPWALRSRLRLRVEMTGGKYSWTPRLTVGGTYGEDARRFLFRIAETCHRVGLQVQMPASGLRSRAPSDRQAVSRLGAFEAKLVAKLRAGWKTWLAVSVILYGAFVALCFYLEIEARARFQVASKADIAVIDDRVQRIRAEAARGRALAAMGDWPPYALYSTGTEVLLLFGAVAGLVLGVVGARGVWRRMRPESGFEAMPMIFVGLFTFFGVLLLLGWPPYAAERYVEDERTTYATDT